MDFNELTTADWLHVLIYGALATYLATSIPDLFRGNAKAGLIAMLFWIGMGFIALAGYGYRWELASVADRVMAVLVPGNAIETGDREVTVIRRADGQFVVNAQVAVNGQIATVRLGFVVDTGASAVVLRAEDAAKLKIPLGRLHYDVEVSTANGRSLAAEVELPRLAIGSIGQERVKALVARPGALHENLLGMSFLGDLASFTISKDKLVLHGR